MAWVIINNNYAANDETATIVTRCIRSNGFTSDGYCVSDDPLTRQSNRGRTYDSFDARVNDRTHGGLKKVRLPYGMTYNDAVEAIRFYGDLR